MEYMLLIHNTEGQWESFSEEMQGKMLQEFMEFTQDLVAKGQFRASNRLQPSVSARTVRYSAGKPSTTDGPFVEAKEALGGYFIIEAKDIEEAQAIASRIPSIKTGDGGVEVRPMFPARVPSKA